MDLDFGSKPSNFHNHYYWYPMIEGEFFKLIKFIFWNFLSTNKCFSNFVLFKSLLLNMKIFLYWRAYRAKKKIEKNTPEMFRRF